MPHIRKERRKIMGNASTKRTEYNDNPTVIRCVDCVKFQKVCGANFCTVNNTRISEGGELKNVPCWKKGCDYRNASDKYYDNVYK